MIWIALLLVLALIGIVFWRFGALGKLRALRMMRQQQAQQKAPQRAQHSQQVAPTAPLRRPDLSATMRIDSLTPGEFARNVWRSRGRRGQGMLVVMLLVIMLLLSQLLPSGIFAPSRNVVRVGIASFVSPDGQQETGRSVAGELVAQFERGENRLTQSVDIVRLEQQVTTLEQARDLSDQHGLDILIWGEVAPGALADSSSLQPQLLLIPRRGSPISSWPEADERLLLPAYYEVSIGPINGPAVLGPLVDALTLFINGNDPERLTLVLADLEQRYGDVLNDKLTGTLTGMLRWAQGDLSTAEAAFRAALEADSDDPAVWNNLGVVLQERGDTVGAEATFQRSLELANSYGVELHTAYVGLGLLALPEDPARAGELLSKAVELRPRQPELLALLARAQLNSGDRAGAAKSVQEALTSDPQHTLAQLEQSRVRLARLAGAGSHLEWDLFLPHPQPFEELQGIVAQLDRVVAQLEQQKAQSEQAAARADAARHLQLGRIYEARAQRLRAELDAARYWLGVARIEAGQAQARIDKNALETLWDALTGEVSYLEQGRSTLTALHERGQRYEVTIQLARAWTMLGSTERSRELYQQAAAARPDRPEAFFGEAQLRAAERQTDEIRVERRALLRRAIEADPRFYPARRVLAQLEFDTEQWDAALEQLTWLAEWRPNDITTAIDRAVVLHRLNRYAEAESILLPLANEGHGRALAALGQLYFDAGHPEAAEQVWRRAVTLDKANIRAVYPLARLYYNSGEYEAAAAVLADSPALGSSMEAQLLLGQIYAGPLNRPQEAIKLYQAAIDSGGHNARNYETLGELFLEANAPDQAAEALRLSIAIEPNVPEARYKLAQAYLMQRQYETARSEAQRAIELAGGTYTEALLVIAETYEREGDTERAIDLYSDAAFERTELPEPYIGLGRIAAEQQQWQIAIGHYEQALTRAPENIQARTELADAHLAAGHYEEALEHYQVLLEADINDPEVLFGSGKAYEALGQQQQALDSYSTAIQRRSNYGAALLARGKLLEQRGLLQAALADYTAAAEADQRLAEPLFLRGVLLMSSSNFAEAAQSFAAAIERRENYPEAYYWLGRSLRAQGNAGAALPRFQRAVELAPNDVEARYYLARTQEELGRTSEAISGYEQVLTLASFDSPWRAEAQQGLDRLR